MKDAARRDYVWNKGYGLKPRTTKKSVWNKIAEVAPSIGEFYPEDPLPAAVAQFEAFIKQSEFDKPYSNEGYPMQEYQWDNPGAPTWDNDPPDFDAPDPVDTAIETYGVSVVFDVETEDKFCPGEVRELTFNMTEPYTGFQVLFGHSGTVVTFVKQNSDNQVVLEVDADVDQRDFLRIVFYMRTVEGITGDSIINTERLACGHYVVVRMGDYVTVYDSKNDKVADDITDNAGTGTVVFPADFTEITNWITNLAQDNSVGFMWSEAAQADDPIFDGLIIGPCSAGTMCDKGFSATTADFGYTTLNAFWDQNCSGVCTERLIAAEPGGPICPPAPGGPPACCLFPMLSQYDSAPCDYSGPYRSWPIVTASTPVSVMSECDCDGAVLTNSLNEDYMYYQSGQLSALAPPGANCPEANQAIPHGCGKKYDGWAFREESNLVEADASGGTFWSKKLTSNFPDFPTVTSALRRKVTEVSKYDVINDSSTTLAYSSATVDMAYDFTLKSPLGDVVNFATASNFLTYLYPDCFFAGSTGAWPGTYEISTGNSINITNYKNDQTGFHWEAAVNAYSLKTRVQIYAARFKRLTLSTGSIPLMPECRAGLPYPNDDCNVFGDGNCLDYAWDWYEDARYAAYVSDNGYYSGLKAQCLYYPDPGAVDKSTPCLATTNATFEAGINDLIDYYYIQEGLGVNDVPDKDDNFEIALLTFSKRA